MDLRVLLDYGLTVTYARFLRCLEDITDDEARRMPAELTPIVWQVGHVAVADFAFARRLDGTSAPPSGYPRLFQAGSGGNAHYPSLDEVRDVLGQAQRRLEELARSADLDEPLEARNYRTAGEMFAFAVYHRGYHTGKITTLRALLGKPRLFG